MCDSVRWTNHQMTIGWLLFGVDNFNRWEHIRAYHRDGQGFTDCHQHAKNIFKSYLNMKFPCPKTSLHFPPIFLNPTLDHNLILLDLYRIYLVIEDIDFVSVASTNMYSSFIGFFSLKYFPPPMIRYSWLLGTIVSQSQALLPFFINRPHQFSA